MSISFGYFHLSPDMIIFIWPEFLKAIVAVFLNVMLFRAGKAGNESKNQKILVNLSIINIVFIVLPFATPSLRITTIPTPNEIIILRVLSLFSDIFRTVPFFLTYGIMMYWYGKKNRDLISRYYTVSAWVMLLCNGFFVISIILPVFGVLTSSPFFFYDIHTVLTHIFLFVYFVGWVFLALHGKIVNNVNLMFAGILGSIIIVLDIVFYLGKGMYIFF